MEIEQTIQEQEETAIDAEAEVVDAEASPEEEPEEVEIDDAELLGAIDEELAESEPQEEEVSTDEPQPEEEVAAEAAEDKAKDEPEPEPKAEAKEEAKEEKPSDEFGTLDENTPEKTRERFETLKSRYDEIAAERDAVQADAQQWKDAIVGTGTNPEQFGMALEYLSKVNSGKPEDLRAAYDIMKGELEVLAKVLGESAPGVYSPLDDHPDLKQRVDDGYLDEKDAMEIIQARASQNLSQASQQQQTEAQNRDAAMKSAMNDVRQLGETLKQTDPAYNQRLPLLEPIIQAVVRAAPNNPETWAASIKDAYAKIPVQPQPAPQPKPQSTAPNSIRPGGTSPSSNPLDKEPGNEMEAIDMALQRGF